MALDLEQDSQLEGATQCQLCLMPLSPLLPHAPQRACSIRPLDKSEDSQIREARMGRVTLGWQPVRHKSADALATGACLDKM